MLLKLGLVIAVIAMVYFFFFKKKSAPLTKERREAKKAEQEDEMVACEVCETYITTSEAIISKKKFYCSVECRDKD